MADLIVIATPVIQMSADKKLVKGHATIVATHAVEQLALTAKAVLPLPLAIEFTTLHCILVHA